MLIRRFGRWSEHRRELSDCLVQKIGQRLRVGFTEWQRDPTRGFEVERHERLPLAAGLATDVP